jgi:hypothetical protein
MIGQLSDQSIPTVNVCGVTGRRRGGATDWPALSRLEGACREPGRDRYFGSA